MYKCILNSLEEAASYINIPICNDGKIMIGL